MNEYIFYTTEGQTIAPKEEYEVKNYQMLGVVSGKDAHEVKENLLKSNPWISEAGFSPGKFLYRQLA